MKISLVSEHASPLATLGGVDAGGQNVHVAALAQALARTGATVTVHTRRDERDLPRTVPFGPGVTVHHVDAGPAEPVPKDDLPPYMDDFARELGAWWSRDRPDVVHSHFWMSGLASIDAAGPLGLPVLHTYHALGVVKRRHQGTQDTSPTGRIELERRLALEADGIIATTSDEARELVAMGAEPDRIAVVPCGVDLAHFRPAGPSGTVDDHHDPDPGRLLLDPRRQPNRVVVVSRLVERKGIGNVIQALRDVPCTELLVAGGPPEPMVDDDPEVRRFRAVAEQAGVADRVTFLGAVQRADVPTLMRSADAALCCPWYEPFGLVAVEAMACGLPVVVSAVGGLAETVLDGITGVHVEPRSPTAIAAALRDLLLSDPERARRMGRAGARRSLRFGWDRIAAETLRTYRHTLGHRPLPAPALLRSPELKAQLT